ncbi:MAG: MFS transporter [Bacillota bacterium]|nr:MFS transporter [Bacillota bacterium]
MEQQVAPVTESVTEAQAMDAPEQDAPRKDSGWKRKAAIFLSSQLITLTGSLVVAYAVIWYITLETSSGTMMMISVLCSCLPQVLVMPVAGVWADRYNRKLLIIAADLFIAAATLILAVLWLSGYQQLWFVFAVMCVRSLAGGIQSPAVNALIPQIVPTEQLTRINALFVTINNLLTLLAPALGGVLLAVTGFASALFFDVGTAVIGVGVLCLLHVERPLKPEGAAQGSLWAEAREGLSYIRGTDWLRMLLLFYAVGFFLVTPASSLTPIFIEREFGPEVWRLSANEIVWSLGAVIGGVAVASWGGFRNRLLSMAVACLAFGVTFVLMGAAASFWFYLLMMGIAGLFLPLFSTAEMTLIQEKTDEQMMGRVFSVINLVAVLAMPLAMLIFGPLADVIDIRYILYGSGGLLALLSFAMIFNKRVLALDADGRPDMPKIKPKASDNITE